MKAVRSKGVSYIELLIVVGLIAIIGAFVSPFLSNFILRNNLETTIDNVVGTIRKAQSYSMDGKNNAIWGICLSDDNIRLYTGSCNSPIISEDFSVSSSISITGLSDTTFSRLRGEPSNTLGVTISTDIGSATISLNAAGGMEVN